MGMRIERIGQGRREWIGRTRHRRKRLSVRSSSITPKFLFVTGGVVSSVGKGIAVASLGRLLRSRGLTVAIMKLDPYINVDPGTMSPYQHGEVFVTDDGAETDLDLGHYERFTDEPATQASNVTTGQVYNAVIGKERRGGYLGGTIQVVPHITNEIKQRIHTLAAQSNADVVICEVGGTVGDIESEPFLEAIRQMRRDVGAADDALYLHVTLLPYIGATHELKTKPTQHSVKELLRAGHPTRRDPLPRGLRGQRRDPRQDRSLLQHRPSRGDSPGDGAQHLRGAADAGGCGPGRLPRRVVAARAAAASGSGGVAGAGRAHHGDQAGRANRAGGQVRRPARRLPLGRGVAEPRRLGERRGRARSTGSTPSKLETEWEAYEPRLAAADGIVVPGGFGHRGIEGKVKAATLARTTRMPYLGLCLGMQVAVIEFARNVLGLDGRQ